MGKSRDRTRGGLAPGRKTEARVSSLVAVMALWIAYLIATPLAWTRYGPVALLLAPTVGVFLYTWLGYLRHELWHDYFPRIHNPTWFDAVSYLIWADPQLYRRAHPTHHSHVHTTGDMEFFCERWATDRGRARRQFVCELALGNVAWEVATMWRLRREPGTWRRIATSLVWRSAISLGLLATVAWLAPGRGWLRFLCVSTLTIWLGAVMTRHLQWVEHLGILGNGPLAARNLLTRNLSPSTPLSWLFNFVNHDDAREHVLHHTQPQQNTRGLPGLVLPAGAREVTIGGYARVLADHYRSLRAPAGPR